MKRRSFIAGGLLAAATPVFAARRRTPVPTTPTPIDAPLAVKNLKITYGPYMHGFMIAPAGKLNWYFANLGLLGVMSQLNSQERGDYVRNYLNLYISKLTANYTIMDVNFTGGNWNSPVLVAPDSDDSYAATFLSLAVRYVQLTQDWAWWDANKATLKNIAYYNLTTQVKANGLISTFQAPHTWNVSYLMDNCENCRGLSDLASVLYFRGELTDYQYYNSFAQSVGSRLSILWDATRAGFKPSDANVAAETSFYPGMTCQLFPQAFGVYEMTSYYNVAWSYFDLYAPQWTTNIYDPYPWAIMGYVAALRGYRTKAQAKQASIESLYATTPAYVTINELGWYQRTKNVLNGVSAI